jgi:ABC-type amino acid transport system permease subunit
MATQLTRTRRFAVAVTLFYALFALLNALLLGLALAVGRWEPRNVLNIVLLAGFAAAAVHRWRRAPAQADRETP